MSFNIDDNVFESRCQGCDTLPTIIPLANLEGPIEGTLFIPENLRCVKCFAYMTTAVRKLRDEEKPKKE